MSREEFIQDLTSRLKAETDPGILQAIDILLAQDTEEARAQRRSMESAILSAQDKKEGRIHSWDEVKSELRSMLNERRENKGIRPA